MSTTEVVVREGTEVERLLQERRFYIAQVRAWRAKGDEDRAQEWLRECERVNARLTELDYFDVRVEVYIELPEVAVEG